MITHMFYELKHIYIYIYIERERERERERINTIAVLIMRGWTKVLLKESFIWLTQ